MANWKKGDKIICVDPGHHEARGYLTKDKVYEVVSYNEYDNNVRLVNDMGKFQGYFPRRFKLWEGPVPAKIQAGSVVRCSYAAGSIVLVEGDHYQVEKVDAGYTYVKLTGCRNWFSISRFVLDKAAPKPKEEAKAIIKPARRDLRDLLEEKVAGRPGTASYAIRDEKDNINFHVRDVCHARMNTSNAYGANNIRVNSKVTDVALSLKNHVDAKERESYLRFVEYALTRSFAKNCFITKDAQEAWDKGVLMNVEENFNYVTTAAIFLRTGSEYSSRLPLFTEIVDAGFSENTAYLYSQLVVAQKGELQLTAMGGGHHFFNTGMLPEQLKKTFNEGFWIREKEMAPYSEHHACRYNVFESVAGVDKNGKDTLYNLLTPKVSEIPNARKSEEWGVQSVRVKDTVRNKMAIATIIEDYLK